MPRTDLTILSAYTREVRQYNESLLLFTGPSVHVAPAGSGEPCPALHDWFHDSAANMIPLVAVGAKVMVLCNVDVSSSVANVPLTLCRP